MDPWYATREDVAAAPDVKASAYASAQIDADLESASRTAERLLRRKFFPWTGTRYFDFPDQQSTATYRIWLRQYGLISLTSITNGDGTALSTSTVFLEPQDGPPYESVEADLSASTLFTSGPTWQRAIAFNGLWGWTNDQQPAGVVVTGINALTPSVVVSGSSAIGVGSLLTVGSERMRVTDKTLSTTGATLGGDIASSAGVVAVPVSSGSTFVAGEVVTINSESMLVVNVTGNTLTVKRAVQGSVLASHTAGATVYAPRTLTVERGATGTTAASANAQTAITTWIQPGPVKTLTIALAVAANQQRIGGWTKAKSDALNDLIAQTKTVYRRLLAGVV